MYHHHHLSQLYLLWLFQVPQSTQLCGEYFLVRDQYSVVSMSSCTISAHSVCVLSQVKDEDEDPGEGVDKSTSVLYLFFKMSTL